MKKALLYEEFFHLSYLSFGLTLDWETYMLDNSKQTDLKKKHS